MTTIEEKLDQLAEFHSQKDSIELQKNSLLDEVKVPAEIEAIVSDGLHRVADVEDSFQEVIDALNTKVEEELKLIVIPDEVKSLLAEIDAKRKELNNLRSISMEKIQDRIEFRKDEIRSEVDAQVKATFDSIEQRRREIEEEFSGKNEDVDKNIEALEKEIKEETKSIGSTVKGKHFMAVYNKGRVTWNTDKLDGMVSLIPQIKDARKEGEPSITLRHI
jgi:hypothetical protein